MERWPAAPLRLVKHFAEDLGLNLSGVELALRLTNQLLELRGQVSSQGNRGKATGQSIVQIDAMLASMGVRVVRQPKTEENPESPLPGGAWFRVSPGEVIEFDITIRELPKQ